MFSLRRRITTLFFSLSLAACNGFFNPSSNSTLSPQQNSSSGALADSGEKRINDAAVEKSSTDSTSSPSLDGSLRDGVADAQPIDPCALNCFNTEGKNCANAACVEFSSCKQLKQVIPSAPSGAYTIDPDGESGTPPFDVYCEQQADGGGWTLAMKLDGTSPTFQYTSSYWTNSGTTNEQSTNLDPTDAKFLSFNTIAFTELRLGMENNGTVRNMVLTISGSSLRDLFDGANDPIITSAGKNAWMNLLPSPSLQQYCFVEGINLEDGDPYNPTSVRIGIRGDDQTDCSSPNSYIGFGAIYNENFQITCNSGMVAIATAPTTGNIARCAGMAVGKYAYAYGFIFVR